MRTLYTHCICLLNGNKREIRLNLSIEHFSL